MGPLWLLIVLLKWLQKRLNHILANRAKLALYAWNWFFLIFGVYVSIRTTTKLTLANDSNIASFLRCFPAHCTNVPLPLCSMYLAPEIDCRIFPLRNGKRFSHVLIPSSACGGRWQGFPSLAILGQRLLVFPRLGANCTLDHSTVGQVRKNSSTPLERAPLNK